MIKTIIQRIRTSKAYSDWIDRNRSFRCACCKSKENINLHHIETLYHSVSDHYKFYGDWEEVFQHILDRHNNDQISCVTLCEKCHTKHHPFRKTVEIDPKTIDTTLWFVAPRTPIPKFAPRQSKHGQIGLIAFQTMLALGNLILQNKIKDRIINTSYKELAKMLNKKNGTAWKQNVISACQSLQQSCVLDEFLPDTKDIEIHMNNGYLQQLNNNPWFIYHKYIHTSSPFTLFLTWLLSFLSKRKRYSIGIEKMMVQLNSKDSNQHRFAQKIITAAKKINWTKKTTIDNGMLHFNFNKKTQAPIFALRKILTEKISQ